MNVIRILIADDHAMVRRGLTSLISAFSDLCVVGTAEDGAAAVRMTAALKPDIVLLDILMPGPDGVDVAQQIHRENPDSRIIILTAYENQEYVVRALRAGVYAYLLKNSADENLVDSIRTVHQGKHLLSPELMDQVLRQFQVMAEGVAVSSSGLGQEELTVLGYIARGSTNEEIAQVMFWSERTVKRKVEDIISKLEARNRAHAVAEAIKRGLI